MDIYELKLDIKELYKIVDEILDQIDARYKATLDGPTHRQRVSLDNCISDIKKKKAEVYNEEVKSLDIVLSQNSCR